MIGKFLLQNPFYKHSGLVRLYSKCSENVTGGIFADLTWAIFVVVVAAVVVVVFLCVFTLL